MLSFSQVPHATSDKSIEYIVMEITSKVLHAMTSSVCFRKILILPLWNSHCRGKMLECL